MIENRTSFSKTGYVIDSLIMSNNKKSCIVVTHGYGGKAVAFLPFAKKLSDVADVCLYSLQAHEFSDASDEFRKAYQAYMTKDQIKEGFTQREAIEDLSDLLTRLSRDYKYEQFGLFGFSAGATISAYAANDHPVKGMYLVAPYLCMNDLGQLPFVHFGIGTILNAASLFVYRGATSLGKPALKDAKIKVPTQVALAKSDKMVAWNGQVAKIKKKFENVKLFEGNHTFNPSSDDYFAFMFKDGIETYRNSGLIDDVKFFFSKALNISRD